MKDQNRENFQYKGDIDTSNPEEVKYWTNKWNISSQLLTGAIKASGSNQVVVIEEYIENRKRRVKRPRYIAQL